MVIKKSKAILLIIMKIILAMFIIPVSLMIIVLSRFLKKKMNDLFQRFGYEPVIYSMMNNNVRGLFDLIALDYKQKRSGD